MKKQSMPAPAQFKKAFAPLPESFQETSKALLLSLQDEKEEKPVKKKITFALVLTVILIIISCTAALALSIWREEADQLLSIEQSVGYYDEWTLEEKMLLLDMMEKNQVEMDQKLLSSARNSLAPNQERHQAADQIIASRYGVNGRIDTVTVLGIMETEMGAEFFDWSIEDMAWFSKTELKYKNASADAEVFTLPGEGELSQAEALQKAKEALKEYRKIDVDQTAYTDTQVQYVVYPYMGAPMNIPQWRFCWFYEDGSAEMVYLSAHGEVNWVCHTDIESPESKWFQEMEARKAELTSRVGADSLWEMEDWVYYNPNRYRLPDAQDISPDAAIALAKTALMEKEGMTQTQLDARFPGLSLRLFHVTPERKWQYIYSVTFTPEGETAWDCYANIFSDTGEIHLTYSKNNP